MGGRADHQARSSGLGSLIDFQLLLAPRNLAALPPLEAADPMERAVKGSQLQGHTGDNDVMGVRAACPGLAHARSLKRQRPSHPCNIAIQNRGPDQRSIPSSSAPPRPHSLTIRPKALTSLPARPCRPTGSLPSLETSRGLPPLLSPRQGEVYESDVSR